MWELGEPAGCAVGPLDWPTVGSKWAPRKAEIGPCAVLSRACKNEPKKRIKGLGPNNKINLNKTIKTK